MAIVSTVNRYRDLLDAVPKGQFYSARGAILPFRDDPYQIRYSDPARASRTLTVTVNDVPTGFAETDVNGIAVVSVLLDAGENKVSITDPTDGNTKTSFFTVRHTATIAAAYADVIEDKFDVEVDDLNDALYIERVGPQYIERFGKQVRQSDPSDATELVVYSTDTYRRLLQELRPAYRHFAATPLGLRQAVEAFTSVSPLVVPREWRPRWILGADLSANGDLSLRARPSTVMQNDAATVGELPNLNVESKAVITPSVASGATVTSGFDQPPHPQRLTITFISATGNATISGYDIVGHAISEVLTSTGALSTASSLHTFAEITSLFNNTASGMSVGVTDTRFIKVVDIGDYNRVGTAVLTYTWPAQTLTWDSGVPVDISTSGSYMAYGAYRVPRMFGRIQVTPSTGTFSFDPIGTGVEANFHEQLWIAKDGNTPLRADLGGATVTIAAAVTAINAALTGTAIEVTGTEEAVNRSILELRGANTGPVPLGSIGLVPGAADATLFCLGLPRSSSRLTATTALGATSLTVVDASRMPVPAGPRTAQFHTTSSDPHNLNGVGIQSISQSTPYGIAGQLRLVISTTTKTLAYKAPGLSLGTAVSVVAGGTFTLTTGGGAHTITVTVTPSMLPTANGTYNDAVEVAQTGQFSVRIRGLRRVAPAGADNGVLTGAATFSTATFSSASYTFIAADVGGSVRVSGTSTVNDGIHRITAVNAGVASLLHQDAGVTFTGFVVGPSSAQKFAVHAPGEQVVVVNNDQGIPGTLTLQSATAQNWTAASYVELVDETPVSVVSLPGPGSISVDVDTDYESAVTASNTVTIEGSNVPDDLLMLPLDPDDPTPTLTNVGTSNQQFAALSPSKLVLKSAVTEDIELRFTVSDVLKHAGKRIRIAVWLQEHTSSSGSHTIEAAFDSVTSPTFVTIATTTIPATVFNLTNEHGVLDPTLLDGTIYVPYDAETCVIRYVRAAPGSGQATVSIEQIAVLADNSTGLFLGSSTVARNAKRSAFGELLYVWSFEPLSSKEKGNLGISTTVTSSLPDTGKKGHIDYITNAHGYWERLDVSEYDADDVPVNIEGLYDETGLLTATLTKMQAVIATPAKCTFIEPTTISKVDQEDVSFLFTGGGFDADLVDLSDHESFPDDPHGIDALYELTTVDKVVLLAHGRTRTVPAGTLIPVPNTPGDATFSTAQPWQFIAANTIRIHADYFDATSTYTVDYSRLIRAETLRIDAGTGYLDYLWLADMARYLRREVRPMLTERTQQLVIQSDLTARLRARAATTENGHRLIKDNGINANQLNQAQWAFVDSQTVKLVDAVFDPNSIYTLTYKAYTPDITAPAQLTLEWRPTDSVGVALQAYREIDVGQVISQSVASTSLTSFRYHQFRLTLRGVVDRRDARIGSLGLKGIHLYGGSPYAPGILPSE